MLQVIGAGYPRTGTYSLRAALIKLLGGDCYHMRTVNEIPEHVPIWCEALEGNSPDWHGLLANYTAAVDWPIASFWPEIANTFPEAIVLLSARPDSATWWRSFDENILAMHRREPAPERRAWQLMAQGLLEREIGPRWDDEAAAKAAYEQRLEVVTDAIPAERLLRWQPEQGWSPLCEALGVPIPAEPFPYLNTTDQRRQMS